MKIKEIKEYGFYQDSSDTVIFEAFQDEDNGKEVLSIMIWKWFQTVDGIKFYETDMFAFNPENNDICNTEVIKLKQKFKIVDDNDPYYCQFGSSSVMYEDKLSNTEKFKKIKKLCEKELQYFEVVKTPLGDIKMVETEKGKFAKKILRIIE